MTAGLQRKPHSVKNEMGLLIARRMSGKKQTGETFSVHLSERERTVPRHCVGAKEWAEAFSELESKFLENEAH